VITTTSQRLKRFQTPVSYRRRPCRLLSTTKVLKNQNKGAAQGFVPLASLPAPTSAKIPKNQKQTTAHPLKSTILKLRLRTAGVSAGSLRAHKLPTTENKRRPTQQNQINDVEVEFSYRWRPCRLRRAEESPTTAYQPGPPTKIKSIILKLNSHKETTKQRHCSAKCPACNRVCNALKIVSRAIIPTICSPSKTGI
jgi:hypothetical protein